VKKQEKRMFHELVEGQTMMPAHQDNRKKDWGREIVGVIRRCAACSHLIILHQGSGSVLREKTWTTGKKGRKNHRPRFLVEVSAAKKGKKSPQE